MYAMSSNTNIADLQNFKLQSFPISLKLLGFLLWLILVCITIYLIVNIDKNVVRKETNIAQLTKYKGHVEYRTEDVIFWMNVINNQPLYEGDIIATGNNGYALLTLKQGDTLEILPNSQIKISEYNSDNKMNFIVTLVKGYVVAQTQNLNNKKAMTKKYKDKLKSDIVIKTDDRNNIVLKDSKASVQVYKSIIDNKVHVAQAQGQVIVETKKDNDTVINTNIEEYKPNKSVFKDSKITPIVFHEFVDKHETYTLNDNVNENTPVLKSNINVRHNNIKISDITDDFVLSQGASQTITNLIGATSAIMSNLQKREEQKLIQNNTQSIKNLASSLKIKKYSVNLAFKEHSDIQSIRGLKEHQIISVPADLKTNIKTINLQRLDNNVRFKEEILYDNDKINDVIDDFAKNSLKQQDIKPTGLSVLNHIQVDNNSANNKSTLDEKQDTKNTKLAALKNINVDQIIKQQMPTLELSFVKSYWTYKSLYDETLYFPIKVIPPMSNTFDNKSYYWTPLVGIQSDKKNKFIITFKGKKGFREQVLNLNISKILKKIKPKRNHYSINLSLVPGFETNMHDNTPNKFFSDIVDVYQISSLQDIVNVGYKNISICIDKLPYNSYISPDLWITQNKELSCSKAKYIIDIKDTKLLLNFFNLLKVNKAFNISVNIKHNNKKHTFSCIKNYKLIAEVTNNFNYTRKDQISLVKNILNADMCFAGKESNFINLKDYNINKKKRQITQQLKIYKQCKVLINKNQIIPLTDLVLKVDSDRLFDSISEKAQAIIIDDDYTVLGH